MSEGFNKSLHETTSYLEIQRPKIAAGVETAGEAMLRCGRTGAAMAATHVRGGGLEGGRGRIEGVGGNAGLRAGSAVVQSRGDGAALGRVG
jgi:hypothetical protein